MLTGRSFYVRARLRRFTKIDCGFEPTIMTRRGRKKNGLSGNPTEVKENLRCRSTWLSSDEPCQQKLPFELWTAMKAYGTSPDADVEHVRANCLLAEDIGMLELSTRKVLRFSGRIGKETSSRFKRWRVRTRNRLFQYIPRSFCRGRHQADLHHPTSYLRPRYAFPVVTECPCVEVKPPRKARS